MEHLWICGSSRPFQIFNEADVSSEGRGESCGLRCRRTRSMSHSFELLFRSSFFPRTGSFHTMMISRIACQEAVCGASEALHIYRLWFNVHGRFWRFLGLKVVYCPLSLHAMVQMLCPLLQCAVRVLCGFKSTESLACLELARYPDGFLRAGLIMRAASSF